MYQKPVLLSSVRRSSKMLRNLLLVRANFGQFQPHFFSRQFTRSTAAFSDDVSRENPFQRTWRVLKNDVKQYLGQDGSAGDPSKEFPSFTDVVVIGGGAMGSSVAHWLKKRTESGLEVVVVEKDPTVSQEEILESRCSIGVIKYAKSSTALSVGGLRQQFSITENIEMSLFGAEFLREIKKHLGPESDVYFNPYGYLLLSSEKGAAQLEANSKLQNQIGAKNRLMSKTQLKEKFPWLDVAEVELGCYGYEKEGWFDPWALLCLLKKSATEQGVKYVTGEAVGFEFDDQGTIFIEGTNETFKKLYKVQVKTPDNKVKTITFAACVLAAGADSGDVARLANIGTGNGVLKIPLPVERRRRYVYGFDCNEEGPGLNTPLTIDYTGTYFRRDGVGGSYICGKSPSEDEEPPTGNLEVDHEFFNTDVWPLLAKRVPAFNNIKVKHAWAGFYEYNYFDQNGIVGPHPFHSNLFIATGFSGHGIQQSPAVGRAIAELILEGDYQTIDLTRFGFDRIIVNKPVIEANIF